MTEKTLSDKPINFIEIDPSLDYQLNFKIKKELGSNLSIGVVVIDENNAPLICQRDRDGVESNWIMEDGDIIHNEEFTTVNVALFSCKKQIGEVQPVPLSKASSLILPEGAAKILPTIHVKGGDAEIQCVSISRLHKSNILCTDESSLNDQEEEEKLNQRARMANKHLYARHGGSINGHFVAG